MLPGILGQSVTLRSNCVYGNLDDAALASVYSVMSWKSSSPLSINFSALPYIGWSMPCPNRGISLLDQMDSTFPVLVSYVEIVNCSIPCTHAHFIGKYLLAWSGWKHVQSGPDGHDSPIDSQFALFLIYISFFGHCVWVLECFRLIRW